MAVSFPALLLGDDYLPHYVAAHSDVESFEPWQPGEIRRVVDSRCNDLTIVHDGSDYRLEFLREKSAEGLRDVLIAFRIYGDEPGPASDLMIELLGRWGVELPTAGPEKMGELKSVVTRMFPEISVSQVGMTVEGVAGVGLVVGRGRRKVIVFAGNRGLLTWVGRRRPVVFPPGSTQEHAYFLFGLMSTAR